MSKPSALPQTRSGEPRAFFGRRTGKKLHKGQQELVQSALPRLEIAAGDAPVDPRALLPGKSRFVIEIGYGGGEHLAREALMHPATGFLGCEVFSGGIAKLVQTIEAERIDNIRLFTDDALKLLMRLPANALDGAYLLYPDPWPKTRHHKRRFVSPTTLDELARVLKPGAWFRFATDIEDYADWTLAHVLRHAGFRFVPGRPGGWHDPFPGWQPTRYEIKARAEGRTRSYYFTFERT
jgi:tRNA (guanine-N7-)-methyltransferase